ncbi:HEAT repeat domain-containing protein [Streptomyces sp. NPDC090442]|uniref:HEAT repeat domain-containing protein n=1 Tax=Streptomyces sp. NPDC090442 TaxID=3365962 RepID=UPI0037F94F9A
MGADAFVAAVRSGDAKAALALLDAGADPDTVDGAGTPALCLAVDAFDLPVVEALLSAPRPVDLNRAAADGRTALLRAIDGGACEIASVLVANGADLRLADAEGRNALDLARYWHVTGAEAELRRRSGASEPVEREAVRDGWGNDCTELSLGGLTVRNGHTSILTELEPKHGIRRSFGELRDRALAEPDIDQPVWSATTLALSTRQDPSVWAQAAALRNRPDPLERHFGAEILRLVNLFDESDDAPFDGPLVDLFLPWVAREADSRVMRALAAGLAEAVDLRAEQPLPELTRHHDREVRRWAVSGLHWAVGRGNPEALTAVTARTRDAEATVREGACRALGKAPEEFPGPSDALAACLDDDDEAVRVRAAVQLALRDDPRGDEVLRGLDTTDEDSPYRWDLLDVWRHRRAQGTAD